MNKFGHGKLKREKLNGMLNEVLQRIRDKNDSWLVGNEEASLGLDLMRQKVDVKHYEVSAEFIIEIKQLAYDEVVMNQSTADQRKKLVIDAEAEVDDLEACALCYEAKLHHPTDWFIQPCARRHEVVWAKISQQLCWPAKLLSAETSGILEVCLFGENKRARVNDLQTFRVKDFKDFEGVGYDPQLENAMSGAHQYFYNLQGGDAPERQPKRRRTTAGRASQPLPNTPSLTSAIAVVANELEGGDASIREQD